MKNCRLTYDKEFHEIYKNNDNNVKLSEEEKILVQQKWTWEEQEKLVRLIKLHGKDY